jgi:hypothetical protein
MRAWSGLRSMHEASHWVGVIATPGAEMGWIAPELYAWVTRCDDGELVCEPAKLDEGSW